jgi:hypothetical protein
MTNHTGTGPAARDVLLTTIRTSIQDYRVDPIRGRPRRHRSRGPEAIGLGARLGAVIDRAPNVQGWRGKVRRPAV